MAGSFKAHIFVVDDDECMLDVISTILESAKFRCTCFTNADDCLHQLHKRSCDLLITDVKMPGKDGIELLVEVKHIAPWLPVLVITSFADIPMAVQAVKSGAFDFIEKPLDSRTFLPVVKSAIQPKYPTDLLGGKPLTRRETIVLRLILQGKHNNEIANLLYRSVHTIELHRSRIMRKLKVHNVVDLVKRAAAMGFDNVT